MDTAGTLLIIILITASLGVMIFCVAMIVEYDQEQSNRITELETSVFEINAELKHALSLLRELRENKEKESGE